MELESFITNEIENLLLSFTNITSTNNPYRLFIALENLLQTASLDLELFKNNTTFSSKDFKLLYEKYIKNDNSASCQLRECYFKSSTYEPTNDNITNYNHMLSGKRTPSLYLVSSMKEVLFCSLNFQNGYYSSTPMLVEDLLYNFTKCSNAEKYIFVCNAISQLDKKKYIDAYYYDDAKKYLYDKSNFEIIISNYYQFKLLLSDYNISQQWLPQELEYFYEDRDMKEWQDELTAQLEELPAPIKDFSNSDSIYNIDTEEKLDNRLSSTPTCTLLFLRNNLSYLTNLNPDYLSLLYWIQFLTDNELESLMKHRITKVLNIHGSKRNDYSDELASLLLLPHFGDNIFRDQTFRMQLISDVKKLINNFNFNARTINTFLELSDYHFQVSKYLYISDILPNKYQKEPYSKNPIYMSDTLYQLFKSFDNPNIKRELDNLCNK